MSRRIVYVCFAVALMLNCAPTRAIDFSWGNIEDPRLREALYDYYREDYFAGIVRLVTNRNYVNLGQEKDLANLLLGSLYIGYAMPDEAKELLSEELDKGIKPEVQNNLWLQLAKLRYQHGQINEAGTALAQIRGKMPKEFEGERRMLQGLILMQQRQPKQAAEILTNIDLRGSAASSQFARYNLGVALIRLGRASEGIDQLKQLVESTGNQPELLALKDQALVAMGYTLLKNKDPAQAKNYLEQVRIDGYLTTKALLGLGWVYSSLNKHKESIAAWMELQKRDNQDPAVLEALLAVPYAYGNLQAYRQAVEQYQTALTRYDTELKKLDDLAQSIRSGKTMEIVLKQGPITQASALQDYKHVTDAAELRYLADFLMSYEFQDAYRNYQDVQTLNKKIQQWISALEKSKLVAPSTREAYMGRLVKEQTEVANTTRELEKLIKRLALSHINNQKDRISGYSSQAKFAMAQIYDQSARTPGQQ